MRLAAVGKLHWSERGLHLCRGEKRVLSQSLIPLGEVLEIREDTAVTKSRGSKALIRKNEFSPLTAVAKGAVGNFLTSSLVGQRALHVQGVEYAPLEKLGIRNAGGLRDNQAEHDVTRTAISPPCSRRESDPGLGLP